MRNAMECAKEQLHVYQPVKGGLINLIPHPHQRTTQLPHLGILPSAPFVRLSKNFPNI